LKVILLVKKTMATSLEVEKPEQPELAKHDPSVLGRDSLSHNSIGQLVFSI